MVNLDVPMADDGSTAKDARIPRTRSALKKQKAIKVAKIEKKRHRKEKNRVAFKRHPKKPGQKGKR